MQDDDLFVHNFELTLLKPDHFLFFFLEVILPKLSVVEKNEGVS